MVVKMETERRMYRGQYTLEFAERKLGGAVYVLASTVEDAKSKVSDHIREGFDNLSKDIIRIWGMPKFGALPLNEAYAENSIKNIDVEEVKVPNFKISLDRIVSSQEEN